MPIDDNGRYTLPDIALKGSDVGQLITSDWQNTTFEDIYNAINDNRTLSVNIEQIPYFDANLQIIRTTSIFGRVSGNLKLLKDLTPSGLPKGAMFYHDSRYEETYHKKLGKKNELEIVCQDIKTENMK